MAKLAKTIGRGDARQALGVITPGFSRFFVNKGQFSLLDVARAVLQQTGPADVSISCWAAGHEDIAGVYQLQKSGMIRGCRWLVGRGMIGAVQALHGRDLYKFGVENIRTNRVHAKMITVVNDRWSIAIRGSANLNTNRQYEQFDVSDSPEIVAVIHEVFDELWAGSPAGLYIDPAVRERAFENSLRKTVTDISGNPALAEADRDALASLMAMLHVEDKQEGGC